MRSVGLTGNIASGKSTVSRLLQEEHGIAVIDADRVARDVVAPGSSCLAKIRARFGDGVLRPDGSLDRDALRVVILASPRARAELEAITHPAIYRRIDDWLQRQRENGAAAAVVEAALLVETGQQRRYDLLLVVSCSPSTQVRRLVEHRGMDEPSAKAWLAAQLPAAAKEAEADMVIRNDGTPEDLARAVAALVPRLIRR